MRKYKIILTVFILLSLFLNSFWIYQTKSKVKIIQTLINQIDDLESEFQSHSKNFILQIKTEGEKLQLSNKIFDERGNSFVLNDLIENNQFYLVVRFSNISCQPCINEHVKLINQIIPDSLKNKIIFLTQYYNVRDLYVFKRLNQLDYTLYKLDYPLTVIDNLSIPYFFCLNNKGTISKVYIPENEKLTKEYLREVLKNLCLKNKTSKSI